MRAPRCRQVGVIKSFDADGGRYTVELSDRSMLALKRANLLQSARTRRPSARRALCDALSTRCPLRRALYEVLSADVRG